MQDAHLEKPFEIKIDGEVISVVKTGYYMRKAFEAATEDQDYSKAQYMLSTALQWARKLVKPVVMDARNRGALANENDFGDAFVDLYTASHAFVQYRNDGLQGRGWDLMEAAAWKIEAAHRKFAVVLSGEPSLIDPNKNAKCLREDGVNHGYGFRHVTLDDFAEHGDGGGR